MTNWKKDEDVGNDPLWGCQADMLTGKPNNVRMMLNFTHLYDLHRGSEDAANQNFSLDNFIAAFSYFKYFNLDESLRHVPIMGRHSWRPDNFFYFLYTKHPMLGFAFVPIVWVKMWISCYRVYKKRPHGVFIATDGKLLAHVMCKAHNWKWQWAVCMWLIKKGGHFKTVKEIYDFYHGKRFDYLNISPVAYEVL